MDWNRRSGRLVAAIVLLALSVPLFVGLASFGIWDPWELASADLARQYAAGEAGALERPSLTIALIARGFATFGIREWSGRLPMALTGVVVMLLAYFTAARFAGRRAGVWAVVVTATTPLFLFNARQMLGQAPAFATSAAVFLCALAAVLEPGRLRASHRKRLYYTAGWLAGLALSIALATLASGVLLGVAPPLLGVAIAIVARNELLPPWRDLRRVITAAIVLAVALFFAIGAAHAVWADYAGFGYWTGGSPRGGVPPTWEVAIERVFHSFAPWSALLPLALARMLRPAPQGKKLHRSHAHNVGPTRLDFVMGRPEELGLRLALVGWIAFAFLAETIFTARYGAATFLAVVGASVAVALAIRDVERTRTAWWGSAIVGFFFVGLIIRDYGKYTTGPIEGLAVEGIEVPPIEVFNPIAWWAIVLGAFGALLALGLAADPGPLAYPELRKEVAILVRFFRRGGPLRDLLAIVRPAVPSALVIEQAKRGVGYVIWLALLGLVLLVIAVFALVCWIAPDAVVSMGMTSLGLRIGRWLILVPFAIPVLIWFVRWTLWLFAKMGSYRLVPALALSLAVGGYACFGFLPRLSSHFSPREVYDTYNHLARRGEPLGEFRVGGRAAAYYATGQIQELDSQPALLEFLRQNRRVWAAFRADDLAAINREYRRQNERHLFVVDARSARMILATNRPVEGMTNQNYLAEAVLDQPPPRIQHPIRVNFDNRVELLGYDLGLPHGQYVGPGEAFTITWYFSVRAPVPGNYQPFVHIDGPGQRINGDHQPVEGRYPMRLWEPGDVIVDRQELRVPANYRGGNLTIYLGFYAGEARLEIIEGPEDDVNRARLGTLPIR